MWYAMSTNGLQGLHMVYTVYMWGAVSTRGEQGLHVYTVYMW